jgi:uncharacterized protein YdiU (UPF0061 family)
MGIVRTGESTYDKEMAKWDLPRSLGGMRPDGYEPFPKMVYKAAQQDNGKWTCSLQVWSDDERPAAEAWLRRCQKLVRSDAEYRDALNDGWRDSEPEAVEHAHKVQTAIADAAAERHFRDARMSEKAQREAAAADAASEAHVPEIPVASKRGRPRKE